MSVTTKTTTVETITCDRCTRAEAVPPGRGMEDVATFRSESGWLVLGTLDICCDCVPAFRDFMGRERCGKERLWSGPKADEVQLCVLPLGHEGKCDDLPEQPRDTANTGADTSSLRHRMDMVRAQAEQLADSMGDAHEERNMSAILSALARDLTARQEIIRSRERGRLSVVK